MKFLRKNEKGFTLIELVMVIVILGILAAVAIPRFIDLQTDARRSVAEGVGGALAGAITMLHAQYLINSTNYDASTVVGSIDSSNLGGLTNAAAVITATVDGTGFTWTYTPRNGVTAAKIAGPN